MSDGARVPHWLLEFSAWRLAERDPSWSRGRSLTKRAIEEGVIEIEAVDGPPRVPEVALWSAVLLQAINDALSPPTWGMHATLEFRREARRYFDEDDCTEVCEMAGIDARIVKKRVKAMIQESDAVERKLRRRLA